MSLRDMMTQTASTKRQPAMSGGKRGEPTTNLTNLLITPLMLSSLTCQHAIRQAIGLEGTAEQLFEAYTESHTHTDSGATVTQMPDIEAGDRLVVESITYNVKWAEVQGLTFGFGQTLILYVTEDKRA
jgi:hypothetical protein